VVTPVRVEQPYQYEKTVWCWSRTLRCTRTKMAVRQVIRDEQIEKMRLVLECCRGYTSEDGRTCEAVCEQPCQHGACSAPDTCRCDDGFGGPDCSTCE
jgi:hypothetical protein